MGIISGWNVSDLWGGNQQPGTSNIPQIDTQGTNPAGPVAGVQGSDSGQQQATSGLLTQMAQGNGPNAGQAIEQQGVKQGQALAQAQAGSARGQMGLANAQHNALQTGAQMTQAGAAQGAVMGAQQQQQAVQALMQNQQAQRAQDLMAQGMSLQQAMAQAQLEAGVQQGNQQAQGNAFNTIVGAL